MQHYIGYIKMVFSGYAWMIMYSDLTNFISFIFGFTI